MADISLLFDVATGSNPAGDSQELIKRQLKEIVEHINSNPLSIKFQVDENSLADIRRQLKEITSEVGALVPQSINTPNLTGQKSSLTQITQEALRTTNAIHSMNVAIDSTNAATIRGALENLGTSINSDAISDIASRFGRLNLVITEVIPRISDLGKETSQVMGLIVTAADEAGNKINQRLRFNKKGKLITDLSEVKIKLAEIKREAKNVNSGKKSGLSDNFTKAKKAVDNYYAALMQLHKSGLNKTIVFDDKNNVWSAKSNGYDLRVAYLNKVTQAYNTASEKLSQSEKNNLDTYITDKQDKLSILSEDIMRAENTKSESLKNVDTVLRSYISTITQGEGALKKWSAAEHSKHETSRDAYSSLQNNVALAREAKAAYENGTGSLEQYSVAVNNLKTSLKDTEGVLKQNGDATKTFSERIGGLAKKFTQWFGVSQVIMWIYKNLKKMVEAVIELDTAMTELKKVTNETDATYERFLNNASTRAKKLGASLSDVVTASADFARLGFNIEEAEDLADAAIVYKNVGDGIKDVSDASESIIATMQAFGVEAKDVMTIVDKFNEVGNNYAISSKGVGDALLRSAAAMHSANNTLDETIALATASNTIVQDPDKVGKCYAQQYSNVLQVDSYIG